MREGPTDLVIRLKISRTATRVQGELMLVERSVETETRAMGGLTCEEVVQALSLTAALAVDPSAAITSSAGTSPSSQTAGTASSSSSNAHLAADPHPSSSAPASAPAGSSLSSGEPSSIATGSRPGVSGPAAGAATTASQHPASAPTDYLYPANPTAPSTHQIEIGAQALVGQVIDGHVGTGGALVARIIRSEGATHQTLGLALLHSRDDLVGTPQGISSALTAFAVSFCPVRADTGALGLTPCAELTGGWLMATGQDIAHPISVERSYWSVGGALRARLAVSRTFAIELQGAAAIPLVERVFTTSAPERRAGQTASIYVSAGLGFVRPF